MPSVYGTGEYKLRKKAFARNLAFRQEVRRNRVKRRAPEESRDIQLLLQLRLAKIYKFYNSQDATPPLAVPNFNMASSQSPSSSPRLPSPPPMAEDQISPSAGPNDDHGQLGGNINMQNNEAAHRRIHPGSRAEDMHAGPPVVTCWDKIPSAFQLMEHLMSLHYQLTQTQDQPRHEIPIDHETARQLSTPPPGVDRGIWLYELARFLTNEVNAMIVHLFRDDPPCSAMSCPEMRASEWQYLCAAHESPKTCCAIDYCCHTLDWCANILTKPQMFPSRLTLGTESIKVDTQVKKMTEIFRRAYRIFAHAWFSHRDAFWRLENRTGLYLLFKTVCDDYALIEPQNYTIPPEAEGIDTTPVAASDDAKRLTLDSAPTLLRRDTVKPSDDDHTGSNTTKRHKHSLSAIPDRSASVATVIHEEVDEDDDDLTSSPEHEVEAGVIHVDPKEGEEEQEFEEQAEVDATDPPSYKNPPEYTGEKEIEGAEPEAESDAESVVTEIWDPVSETGAEEDEEEEKKEEKPADQAAAAADENEAAKAEED